MKANIHISTIALIFLMSTVVYFIINAFIIKTLETKRLIPPPIENEIFVFNG